MIKILLVDDDEDVRMSFKCSLERFGHAVIVAKDGREAISLSEGETACRCYGRAHAKAGWC